MVTEDDVGDGDSDQALYQCIYIEVGSSAGESSTQPPVAVLSGTVSPFSNEVVNSELLLATGGISEQKPRKVASYEYDMIKLS